MKAHHHLKEHAEELDEDKAKELASTYKADADKVEATLKKDLAAAVAKAKKLQAKETPALTKAAKAVAKKLPKLTKVVVSSVSLDCLLSGPHCDAHGVKMPTIKACFTNVGCSAAEPFPGMLQFATWIRLKARQRISATLASMLTFEAGSLEVPGYLLGDSLGEYKLNGNTFDLDYGTGITKEKIPLRVAVSADTAHFDAESSSEVAPDFEEKEAPLGPFSVDALERKMVSQIDDPEEKNLAMMIEKKAEEKVKKELGKSELIHMDVDMAEWS